MRATYFIVDLLTILAAICVFEFGCRMTILLIGYQAMLIDSRFYVLLTVGLMAVSVSQKAYSALPPRPVKQFRGWVIGSICTWTCLVCVLGLLHIGNVEAYLHLAGATCLSFLMVSFNRAVVRIVCGKAWWWGTRVLLVATEGMRHEVIRKLLYEPQWGIRVAGVIADRALPTDPYSFSWLGDLSQIEQIAKRSKVRRAITAVHAFDQVEIGKIMSDPESHIRNWVILPGLEEFPSLWLESREIANLPGLSLTNALNSRSAHLIKRFMDVSIVVILSLAVIPFALTIALLIRWTSPGSVFYAQERIGRKGKRFKAWKFRTMQPNADQILAEFLAKNHDLAAEWKLNHKLKNDPRVTRVGRFLRWSSLDEIPQLWNVLRGEMSLVGPRPIVQEEICKYEGMYEYYTQVLPGITGLWQVSGRNNTTYDERVRLDTYYARNWSIWLDMYILACTVKVVVLGEGAY
jgi:Undecaprenyl-phosphate galactose phosphotransferase WbaP